LYTLDIVQTQRSVAFTLCAWTELFSEKNVISVSIDVIRRNAGTKISKLKHPDGAHCTLQTSSLKQWFHVKIKLF